MHFSKLISEDPKDLIRKCLVVDPSKRITVTEALKHPFFNTVVSSREPARVCVAIKFAVPLPPPSSRTATSDGCDNFPSLDYFFYFYCGSLTTVLIF